ncbi:MAG: hypothetical protein CO113_00045 [Elusimicrobia bacterium CG_4_9_14_3_um_filter_62_55]|nr:MAG: hypothetical protein COR54_17715 [Elusimicrobia bacterium CG22_combo_CG10-13_8_21_14_all_63_91]PJA15046.1 MAG: hypothetical protein COX66_11050 [Elusimicrobia bacterium CG_4_10_14_0_2_um_filter_63_34]PJB27127.1 MAG: hypothetical protein CO113_00045 [Elusimicrobia bacterium CG_4_9_14_3_um_filter_62_55]
MSEKESPDDGVFVEAGGFRVDRRRAVRKLQRFQLPGTFGASMLLIRAAVASGASHVRIAQQTLFNEVRFDGEPFPYRFLQDPYAPILGDKECHPRERSLALGLMHLLDYRPRTVTIRTGANDERYALAVSPEGIDSAREDLTKSEEDGETDTAIQTEWSVEERTRALRSQLTRSALRWNCAMCPATIALGDSLIHAPEDDFPRGEMFSWNGARVVVDEAPVGTTGTLELFHYGVKVQRLEVPYQERGFHVWVDDPGFALNASLSAVVQDERFKRLFREIKKAM